MTFKALAVGRSMYAARPTGIETTNWNGLGLVPVSREVYLSDSNLLYTVAGAALSSAPSTLSRDGVMRELEVREAVRAGPLSKYLRDSSSRVIDELAICLGEARIDIAVVNGKLSGYELKSENDTLARLPKQIEAYGRVFDEVTLVLDQRHAEAAALIVPVEWGLIEVRRNKREKPVVKRMRSSAPLHGQDPYSIAQLLWKAEALEVLSKVTGTQAPTSKSRPWIWTRLVESLSLPRLKHEVREALKLRLDWRT